MKLYPVIRFEQVNSVKRRKFPLSVLSLDDEMPGQICILWKNKSLCTVVFLSVSLSKYWSVFAYRVPQAVPLLPVLFSFGIKAAKLRRLGKLAAC